MLITRMVTLTLDRHDGAASLPLVAALGVVPAYGVIHARVVTGHGKVYVQLLPLVLRVYAGGRGVGGAHLVVVAKVLLVGAANAWLLLRLL